MTMSTPNGADARSSSANEAHPRRGVSRRDFLRLAGLGGSLLALGSPATSAAAAEATSGSSGKKRIVGWMCWDGDGDVYTPFIFEPSFFSTSAMEYNPHLATFGCCVALSSFNADSNGQGRGDYTNEHRNIRSLLNQIGMGSASDVAEKYEYQCDGYAVKGSKAGNVAWNEFFETRPNYQASRDPQTSIGLCAGWRRIKILGKNYNLVVMGIRGGNYGVEWAGNLTAGETGNHKGFQEAADQASRFLKAHIREWGLSGKTKILICGYSRAAATTNLTAGNIVRWAIEKPSSWTKSKGYYLGGYFDKQIELDQSDLYAYCYEAPAGVLAESDADKTAVHEKYANIHSIINPCDLVPKVMPKAWNFTRYGKDMVLPGPSDRASYLRDRDNMLERMSAVSLHKGEGKQPFSYSLDTFPSIDFSILKTAGQYALTLWDMKCLDIYMEKFFNDLATEGIRARVEWTRTNTEFIFFSKSTVCPGYARKFQPALVEAILVFDELSNDPNMTTKGADEKSPLEKLMSSVSDKINAEITGLFTELFAGKPLTHVTDAVASALKTVTLNDGKTSIYNYKPSTATKSYGERILWIVHSFIDFDYYECIEEKKVDQRSSISAFAYKHIQEVVAFAQKSAVIISAHMGDLVLSWMQSLDPYYYGAGAGDIEGAPDLAQFKASLLASGSGAAAASEAQAYAADGAAVDDTDSDSDAAAAATGEAATTEAADAATTEAASVATTGKAATDAATDAATTAATTDAVTGEAAATGAAAASEASGADAATEAATASTTDVSAASETSGDVQAYALSSTSALSLAAEDDEEVWGDEADVDGDEDEDGSDDKSRSDAAFVSSYRKVIFSGSATIYYTVNGQNYLIFENEEPVYDDGEKFITVEGKDCPFIYGLDADRQQVVMLPDTPNGIDGTTTYTFNATTEPDVPLKCAVASYEKLGTYPTKAYIYEPFAGFYDEPLEVYQYEVKIDRLNGSANSASGESGEDFSCSLSEPGWEWQTSNDQVFDSDKEDQVAARYCYIEARSSDAEMGGTYGGGTVLRGMNAFIVALPNDGYEFDYWTLDDKWMVDGEQQDSKHWVDYTTDSDGNTVRVEPEIPEGEWVEGKRVEGEMYEDKHAIRPVADDYHLVTAHFKAKSSSGGNGGGADPSTDDGGNGNNDDDGGKKKGGEGLPQTGDPAFAAVAGVAAAAGVAAIAAGSMAETED